MIKILTVIHNNVSVVFYSVVIFQLILNLNHDYLQYSLC